MAICTVIFKDRKAGDGIDITLRNFPPLATGEMESGTPAQRLGIRVVTKLRDVMKEKEKESDGQWRHHDGQR